MTLGVESPEPHGVLQGQVKGPIPESGESPPSRETVEINGQQPCGIELEDHRWMKNSI